MRTHFGRRVSKRAGSDVGGRGDERREMLHGGIDDKLFDWLVGLTVALFFFSF